MLVESLAIIALIFAMAFAFLRAGKKEYAYGILPLLLLPVVQIFLGYITSFFASFLPFDARSIRVCIICVTLIAACILIGLSGSRLHKKSLRTVYFVICGLFTLILAMFFILDILKNF